MRMVKLDSPVDVTCDFCSRTGRRGYIMADVSGLEVLCPACFTFLYGSGGWKPGEAWKESEVSWVHANMPGDKNE